MYTDSLLCACKYVYVRIFPFVSGSVWVHLGAYVEVLCHEFQPVSILCVTCPLRLIILSICNSPKHLTLTLSLIIVIHRSKWWHFTKKGASGKIHPFPVGLYHTWHLDFIAEPTEIWIIIMYFTTVVILSPLQRIGCDYHILLPRNYVIITNESAQCTVVLPHSLFLSHLPVFRGSTYTIQLSLSFKLKLLELNRIKKGKWQWVGS